MTIVWLAVSTLTFIRAVIHAVSHRWLSAADSTVRVHIAQSHIDVLNMRLGWVGYATHLSKDYLSFYRRHY